MMIFFEYTDVARFILTRIASYSVSLLYVGKSSRIACSILSLVGALSCKLTLAPVCRRCAVYIKDPPANIIQVHIPLGNLC